MRYSGVMDWSQMPKTTANNAYNESGLLRNRNFVFLWCAYAISAVGDHLSEMAILKTQNALSADVDITPLTARITFMFFIPFFLLAPVAGWLADRLPRRVVMITADVIRSAILFSFAWLIGQTQGWGTWGPFVPMLLVGIFAAFFSPARQAILPTLIRPDQLTRANGMISALGFIATMFSVAISGYLADHYVPHFAFRIDALTFLASAVFLLLMRFPKRYKKTAPQMNRPSPLKEFAGGVQYIRSHRYIRELLIVTALIWFCGPLVNSVIPAIVRDVYHGSFTTIASYRAYLGVGLIGGAVMISILGGALRSEVAITWGMVGISMSIAIFALSVFLPLDPSTLSVIGAIGIVLAGFFATTVMASFNSLLQRMTANRYRGRVFGIKDVCTTGSLLLATGMLGIPQWTRMDQWVGWILVAVAIIMFGAGMWSLQIRLQRGAYSPKLNFLGNLNEFVARFWWRFKRIGPSTVPRTGPVIITSNHRNAIDPLLFYVGIRYRLPSFMVAAEYNRWFIIRYITEAADCMPVHRGTRDISSTKQALRHLKNGKAIAIFVDGGIVKPGEMPKPKDGVAMLALKTGVQVIPAYISGTNYREGVLAGLFTRHQARIRFGQPVDLSEFRNGPKNRETIRAATRKIYETIRSLAPETESSTSNEYTIDQIFGTPESTE